jgi:iron complex outermembrane receptor protein
VNGLHHGTASFEIGDSTLTEETAYNFSGQIKYEADTSWDADLTLYANFINGFINLVPQTPPTLTLRGAFPTFRYIQTDALLYGADFRVERTFSRHWSSAVKGAFLWARDRQKNDWLQQMPANRLEGQLTWSFAGKRFRNGYISPSVLYVFRQDRVPSDAVDYLPPPDAYALLHLEFATSFDMFRKNTTLNVGVQNLLNRKYRDYMNRFRYFNDEMGRNVIIQLKIDLF